MAVGYGSPIDFRPVFRELRNWQGGDVGTVSTTSCQHMYIVVNMNLVIYVHSCRFDVNGFYGLLGRHNDYLVNTY
jgi:ABC-type enterochelin transport system permease subunit